MIDEHKDVVDDNAADTRQVDGAIIFSYHYHYQATLAVDASYLIENFAVCDLRRSKSCSVRNCDGTSEYVNQNQNQKISKCKSTSNDVVLVLIKRWYNITSASNTSQTS